MTAIKSRQAPPRATAMIEALRGLGYSPAAALADIIDNSISAGANQIDLQFLWDNENTHVTIYDNGSGMDGPRLDLAMRLGEKSPLDVRQSNDLGRFGLGLKTASFSQCRSLTVSSKPKNGEVNSLRWDLDILAESTDGGWHLLEDPEPNTGHLIDTLKAVESGTLVIWGKLDRMVMLGSSDQDFLDLIDAIERHLSMVFHRFLDGTRPRLVLTLNGRRLKPWDPFLSSHHATWSSPVEKISTGSGMVEVQCYVLPHKDHLDQEQYDFVAGPDGWTAQQGFYVYRNQRLLVAGSWLGLGQGRSWTKEEAHKLARIRVDITNSADADWKIDIRKSTARPPFMIRNRLMRLAEDTRSRARRVFAHRGDAPRSGDTKPVTQAWSARKNADGMRYSIDLEHPAVRSVLDDAGAMLPQIKAMLRVIEETVPVQRIWLDTTEGQESARTGFAGTVPEEVKSVLEIMFKNMVAKKGMSEEAAKDRLLHTEPFQNYPELIASLGEAPLSDGNSQ